jgi:hypothetical protein
VYVVRATGKLLRRLGPPDPQPVEPATTLLDTWYATTLPWRKPVALFVNEPTRLPVLAPIAPARTPC